MQEKDPIDQTEGAPVSPLDAIRMDKTVFSVVSSFEEAEEADKAYWAAQTPAARLEALELMRQVVFGYDPLTARMERVIEVVKRVPH
jgi:hypothetical protein